jgi:predicted transcriptional regulator
LETAFTKWLSSRRDQFHIVNEILDVAKQGASKTRIMYRVNLSFAGVNHYLTFMVRNKLLLKSHENCKTVYYPSEKGLTFLSSYIQLVQLLQ